MIFSVWITHKRRKRKEEAYRNVQLKFENKDKIDLFPKRTSETGLLTSVDHIDHIPVPDVLFL